MKHLKNSKWTAIKIIHNWRHYEVINVSKKEKKVEMFAVCANKIRIEVSFEDLKNQHKWLSGWDKIVD
jgi:tryptophan-rich hypothetical protein